MLRMTGLGLLVMVGCSGGPNNDVDDTDTDGGTGVGALDLDLVTTTEQPSKRSEVLAAVHEATNSIMIFGGNDGPIVAQIPAAEYRNDTWVFEPGTGWFSVDSADKPKKRGRYTVTVDEEGSRALLFGGRFRPAGESGNYELFNDLWQFDFLTREWTELDSGGAGAPDGRYYPASAWVPETGELYVWGGLLNEDALVVIPGDDLWVWDGSSWRQETTSGDQPTPRGFFGATYDTARNQIVVHGGNGDFFSLAENDLYALSLDTFEWEELHDGSGRAPSTRMHAHLLYDDSRDVYVLWGGHTDNGDMNDLWFFDPESREWSKEYIADKIVGDRFGCLGNDSEVPANYVEMDLAAPERRHRGMVGLLHDNLWIFGGMHAECSDHLDDTWRYELSTETYHELIEAQSGESCLRANEDCECLCI